MFNISRPNSFAVFSWIPNFFQTSSGRCHGKYCPCFFEYHCEKSQSEKKLIIKKEGSKVGSRDNFYTNEETDEDYTIAGGWREVSKEISNEELKSSSKSSSYSSGSSSSINSHAIQVKAKKNLKRKVNNLCSKCKT